MIHLERVVKYFDSTLAVDGLSLEVPKGEVCVLIGPSGCGKTTTLRMINRLVEPSSGRIYVDGKDIRDSRPELLRRSMGYAIQSVGLFPHMTAAENIAVVPRLMQWDGRRIVNRVKELLELVGLEPDEYVGKYPAQLSGGEAQRVGVARALAADPPILLMDEPFGAVDPLTREKLQNQFAQIQGRLHKTVILVTHDLDEAIKLADKIAIMESGKLVQYDTPEAVLSKPASKFVHDFVGTDRALKRLSRISVRGFIKPGNAVKLSASVEEIRSVLESRRWAWVVNEGGQLLGWIDYTILVGVKSLEESIVAVDSNEIAVSPNATFREALSRMLGQGLKYIPVVDERKVLIGQVELSDIEAATAEAESGQ